MLLCASVAFVEPASLYLAMLRARERVGPLVGLPLATIVILLALAPVLELRYGLAGVAAAWVLANAPFGSLATWRLVQESKEVSPAGAAPLGRRPHMG